MGWGRRTLSWTLVCSEGHTWTIKSFEGSCKTMGSNMRAGRSSTGAEMRRCPGGRLHCCRLWVKTGFSQGTCRNALNFFQAPGAGPAICIFSRVPCTSPPPLQHHRAGGCPSLPEDGRRTADPGLGVGTGWAALSRAFPWFHGIR